MEDQQELAAAAADDNFDIVSLMNEAVDPLTGTLRDLALDDRDLPLAKSFFDFSTNFCDANPPWARQMIVYTHLFGDYCPKCSNPAFLDPLEVPIDYSAYDLPGEIQFLNYGKCPKCGGRKHEFVKHEKLRLYQELVLVWGQRSGKSLTGSLAMAYTLHRFLKLPKLATLYPQGIQQFTPLTGTLVSLNFAKAINLLWSPLLSIINLTPWFCLDGDSLVTMSDGTKKRIAEVEAGDMVKTSEGDRAVVQRFDNGVKETLEVTLDDGTTLTGTDAHMVRVMLPDGVLIWKCIGELEPGDEVVVE